MTDWFARPVIHVNAWLFGMAERLAVPAKPGNSGGGKGLQLEGGRKKRRRKGRLAKSLTTPELFPEVAHGVICKWL
jgi:hypothetical protein